MSSIVKIDELAGLESVLIEGNLARLSTDQRISYYKKVCESVGLNPLTQPFEYLTLQGKMILYARRACTDQLRQIHGISVSIVAREKVDGIYVVTARAVTPNGRCDESIGAVPIDNLKGENLSNALMKAETKSKRRVTLAICGLSFIDESELESVRDKATPTQARSLDDIANTPAMLSGAPGYREAVPVDDIADRHPQVMSEPEPADDINLDEYGLPIPSHPCPKVRKGKPDAGKLWSELDARRIAEMYNAAKSAMTPQQVEWCEYLMMRHGARKEAENVNV